MPFTSSLAFALVVSSPRCIYSFDSTFHDKDLPEHPTTEFDLDTDAQHHEHQRQQQAAQVAEVLQQQQEELEREGKEKGESSEEIESKAKARLKEAATQVATTTKPGLLTASGLKSFLGGAFAGGVARTAVAPFDRVKLLFQASPVETFTWRKALAEARRIVREERGGVRALWKGNSATLVRTMPYSAITLTTFDHYCHVLVGLGVFAYGKSSGGGETGSTPATTVATAPASSSRGELRGDDCEGGAPMPLRKANALERFLAGAMSGATAVVMTYPLDVMRARLALQTKENSPYRGLFPSMRLMYAEGGIGTFFRGMKPTLVGILPYAGTSYMVFHTSKDVVANFGQDRGGGGERDKAGHGGSSSSGGGSGSGIRVVLQNLACGVFAGLTSQSLTYPIDMVRRRMQTVSGKHPGNAEEVRAQARSQAHCWRVG